MMYEKLRLAIVADGDPRLPTTNSGVASGLLEALHQDSRVDVVATIDSTPTLRIRLIVAVASVLRNPRHWRSTYRKGSVARWARSRQRDKGLRGIDVDAIVHVRNTYRPAACPYVSFVDNVASLSQHHWDPWKLPKREFARRFSAEKQQFENALAVYTAGQHVRDEIIETYGIAAGCVVAIGGGVNALPPSSQARNPKRALFVGLDFDRKGGRVLLRAFSKLVADVADAELIVVGPEEPLATIKGVRWVGRIRDRQALSDLYASSSVFVLPANFEPYGLVIAEAMSSGLACVVSDVNELPRLVVNNQTGVVVPKDDSDLLATALGKLLTDHELARRLGEAGRRSITARRLTWADVEHRMIDSLLEKLNAPAA